MTHAPANKQNAFYFPTFLRGRQTLCYPLLFAAFSISISGCATTQMPAHKAVFSLFVNVTPKNAQILIDDKIVANGKNTADIPIKVQAGTRRITIQSDGYYPFKTTLEYIQPGETYTLSTHLIASEF